MTEIEHKKVLPLTVLLVDDDQLLLDMYALEFRQRGFTVMTAVSAPDALDLIEAKKPNLIFTDLMMKEKDGFWLLENIRNHTDKDIIDLPVAVLTDRDDLETRKRCESLRCLDFFVKVRNIPSALAQKAQEILISRGFTSLA